MTIASEANRSGPYDCNGATTHFPYGFQLYDQAHIRAILTAPDGAETTMALGTDYTVSGVGDTGGGEIVTSVAPGAGHKVTLILNVPFTQNVDLENQGAYFAETIERAFDLQTQMSLQLKEQVARSVVLPVTSSVSVDKLTGAVLSLSEIQPDMQTLAPIAADIKTVAGISSEVVAAEGHANTASAAAVVATSKAAEAAASAEAAATFDPASFYPRVEFKADGTANAPVKYGLGGEVSGSKFIISGSVEDQPRLEFWKNGFTKWGLSIGIDGLFRLYNSSVGTVVNLSDVSAAADFTKMPMVAGVSLTSLLGSLKNARMITVSGDVRPSSGATKWLGILVGGANDGGASTGSNCGIGAPGGAGCLFFTSVSDAAQYPIIIGGKGGNSIAVIASTTFTANGNGGVATNGLINLAGAPCGDGTITGRSSNAGQIAIGPAGGDGPFGLGVGGGGGIVSNWTGFVTHNGISARGYGAGGGAAAGLDSSGVGGAGTPGCLFILEF